MTEPTLEERRARTERITITFFGDKLGSSAQMSPEPGGLSIGWWGKDDEGRTTLTLLREHVK